MLLPRRLRWSAFSLRTKLLIVVALPMLPLAVFWTRTAWRLLDRPGPGSVAEHRLAGQAAPARLLAVLLDADAGARDYLLTDNAAARLRFEGAMAELPLAIARLEARLDDPVERESFAKLDDVVNREVEVLKRLVSGQAETGPSLGERAALDRSAEYLDTIRSLTLELENRRTALTAADLYRGELTNTVLLWSLLIGSIACAAGGAAVALLVAGSVSRRVRILAMNADRLARGDALHSPRAGEDEIAQLDRRFRDAAGLLRARESELRRRTAELEAANRELEAFSYSVSHDLRAPLRAINGFSEILETACHHRLDADGRDALRRVRAAAERMDTLIEALIDLAKLTTADLNRERVDVTAASHEIVEELVRQAPGRPVEIAVEPNLSVDADPHLLRTALQNLIDNAVKYSARSPRPRIEIGSSPNGHARVFYVRDNGVGFSMQHATRLFSPFQRLHSDREFPGTGIGLAVVHRVVERHGGRIWAESDAGRGAAFFFTLEPEASEAHDVQDPAAR